MIPGISSVIAGIGKLILRSATISTVQGPSSITCPSVAAGDVAIFIQYAANQSSSPGLVVPSGFNNINFITYGGFSNEYSLAGHFKVMNGTETGSSLVGMSGARDNGIALYLFRFSKRVLSASSFSPNITMTTGDPGIQTINASGQTKPSLFFAHGAGTFSGTLATNGSFLLAPALGTDAGYFEFQNLPLANRTIDCTSVYLQSFGLALTF